MALEHKSSTTRGTFIPYTGLKKYHDSEKGAIPFINVKVGNRLIEVGPDSGSGGIGLTITSATARKINIKSYPKLTQNKPTTSSAMRPENLISGETYMIPVNFGGYIIPTPTVAYDGYPDNVLAMQGLYKTFSIKYRSDGLDVVQGPPTFI